ncbi:MAG: sporulation integral membrane protein YtvI [Clostridia bacterium]|nr:sporulation integral membrane protein YtvI [Clostridia bacterium]
MTVEQQKNFIIKALFYSLTAALVFIVLKLITGILFPFAAALLITVSLQGTVDRLVKNFRIRRKPASVMAVTVIFSGVGLVIFWLVRALYRQTVELIEALPSYSENITSTLNTLTEKFHQLLDRIPFLSDGALNTMPSTALDTVTERLASALTSAATSFAAGVPKFVLSLLVMIIASIYFAKDFDDIKRFLKGVIEQRNWHWVFNFKEILHNKTARLLRGYFLIILLTFFELSLGLMLLRVKYALIIAAVTAVVDILPILGSGTVLIPWAVVSALLGNTGLGIGLVVLYLIITTVRNFTEPRIIGSKIGVHPLVMLAAVFLGLTLFGAVGVIAAPLLTVTAKAFYDSSKAQQNQKDPTP